VCSAVLAARHLVEKCLDFWLAVAWKHKNCGKFRGNYHTKVLVLQDLGTRVIVPQRSAQSEVHFVTGTVQITLISNYISILPLA